MRHLPNLRKRPNALSLPNVRSMWPRMLAFAAGAALIGVGAAGLIAHAADTAPIGWALWVGGAAVAHDLILAPAVLAAGVLVSRFPAPVRGPARAVAVVAGCVTLVALPLVLGLGRRAGDSSRLPLPYGPNLAMVVVLTAVAVGCTATLAHAYREGMSRTILTILGVVLAVWVIMTVVGMIIHALKFFFFIGLLVLIIMGVVAFVGRSGRRH